MSRSLLALLLLGVVGISQGCRICDSPYDYCGPVMPCGEGCGCGPGGCGHGHYDGGYIDSGYGGGHGGCATCGNGGGGHPVEYANEYEGGSVIQGQPIPAPEMIQQGRRPSGKTSSNSVMKPTTKASYERPAQAVRAQPATMQAKPAKMSPQPTMKSNSNRMASNNSKDSGRGLIFW